MTQRKASGLFALTALASTLLALGCDPEHRAPVPSLGHKNTPETSLRLLDHTQSSHRAPKVDSCDIDWSLQFVCRPVYAPEAAPAGNRRTAIDAESLLCCSVLGRVGAGASSTGQGLVDRIVPPPRWATCPRPRQKEVDDCHMPTKRVNFLLDAHFLWPNWWVRVLTKRQT